MTELTKAELVTELEPRIRKVENDASTARGAVSTLKWILGIAFPSLIGMGIWVLSDMKAHQATDVARLDKAIDKLDTRLAQRLDKVTLTSGNGAGWQEYTGKFVSVTKDKLTLDLSQGNVAIAYTFPLGAGARLLVKGAQADIHSLKPGDPVRVLYIRGHVELIELRKAVEAL